MQVKLNHFKHLHFKASARNFKNIDLDEPKSFHGSNLGPSPVEYLLIGIGGCLGNSFMFCLIKHGIEIENLEIIVDGKIHHKPPTMRLKLMKVDVKIMYVLKNLSQLKQIEQCKNEFMKHCVVSDTLINGIPINVEFQNKN
ncbi:MAG: OsmC family protein [Candidatus Odinarchaeota archaeon]